MNCLDEWNNFSILVMNRVLCSSSHVLVITRHSLSILLHPFCYILFTICFHTITMCKLQNSIPVIMHMYIVISDGYHRDSGKQSSSLQLLRILQSFNPLTLWRYMYLHACTQWLNDNNRKKRGKSQTIPSTAGKQQISQRNDYIETCTFIRFFLIKVWMAKSLV